MKLGSLLRTFRDRKKLSQSHVADQVGVSQSTYFAWENDRSLPKATYFAKLATLFGVDMSELLTDELTVTVSTSTSPAVDPTVLNAKTLYEDLTYAMKHTIMLQQQRIEQLEAENRQLKEQLKQP